MLRKMIVERTVGECDLCGEELSANDILRAEKNERNVSVTAKFDDICEVKVRGIMCARCRGVLITWWEAQRQKAQKEG